MTTTKTLFTIFGCFLLSIPSEAEITLSKSKDYSEAFRTGVAQAGWTEVAAGNSKGQTIVLKEEGHLSGIVLQAGPVSSAVDLKLKIYPTSNGFPSGDAIFSDTGRLPKDLSEGDCLQIDLASPLPLPAGTYAIVLESESSKLRFRLNQSDGYPDGRLIRRNGGSEGKWKEGAGKGGDLVFRMLGDISATSAGQAAEAVVVKLNHEVSTNVQPLCERLPEKPNIVVCMVDDLGWNQISVSQSTMGTARTRLSTPNLESLANRGLSFTHAYAQPNCAPTRAAMLSGQYPARIHNDVYVVGSLNRFGRGGISAEKAQFIPPKQTEDVAPEAITLAEALRENGYATAHIGKYHVGNHEGEKTLPENVGFDINIGGCEQGHQPVCFATKNGQDGKWGFRKLGRGDFDKYAEPYTEGYVSKHGFPSSLVGTPKHVSDAVGDAMEETLGIFNSGNKPFYLQLHPYAVHGPVKSRPDLKATAKGDDLAGFIASIDLIIGRLLKAIDDPNDDGDTSDSVAANTLILFTSDNGGTHGHNLPLRGKKGMFTEGGIRVPLIAYWPGVIPANTVTNHMVHSVDYYPTYLELAGKGWMPPEDEHPLDGESFADILRKPDIGRKRAPVFYFFPGYMDVRAQPCAVAIDEIAGKRYKLLYFYEADAWELYNFSDDIGEGENLIKTQPEVAAGLSAKINAWLNQQHPTWKPKFPLDKQSGKPVGPPPLL